MNSIFRTPLNCILFSFNLDGLKEVSSTWFFCNVSWPSQVLISEDTRSFTELHWTSSPDNVVTDCVLQERVSLTDSSLRCTQDDEALVDLTPQPFFFTENWSSTLTSCHNDFLGTWDFVEVDTNTFGLSFNFCLIVTSESTKKEWPLKYTSFKYFAIPLWKGHPDLDCKCCWNELFVNLLESQKDTGVLGRSEMIWHKSNISCQCFIDELHGQYIKSSMLFLYPTSNELFLESASKNDPTSFLDNWSKHETGPGLLE